MKTKRKYFPTLHKPFVPWRPEHTVHGMGILEITHEQHDALADVCLGIFADMANAGAPLQEILAACYMSGVQHTLATLRPNAAVEARR